MSTDADRPQPAAPGNTLAPPDPGPPVPTGTTDTLNSNALLERPSAQPPSATRTDDATSGEQPNRIRCPHCQNPIDIADRRADEILCPGCGSSFHLRDARHTDTTSTSRPLGKFQLLERVGVGAFGAVWKARDTELDRIVALKIPHSGLLSEGQELERFHREARAAAQLRHPNIVPVHAVLTLEGLPTIVADFIDGVPLRDFLSGRRPTFREAAALIADIADALEYAHCRGLVHRDVKPANVMLERDPARRGGVGRPLLMDFGLALRDGAEVTLTLDGHVIGTPAYMSPEQASGKSHNADRRSDVYSLGVVLYELLTGELPFRGTKMMILHQVLQEEPRPPRKVNDKVPHDLETVCLKCLEKEPSRRYPTAGELAADLRRYLAGEPVHARPAGRVEKAVKWARRRPAIAGLLAAVVFLTVAGVGGISWAYGRTLKALARADTALDAAGEANRRRVRGQVEQLGTAAPQAVPDLLKALAPERAEALPHLRELYAGSTGQTRYALALLPDEPALRDELAAAMLNAVEPREMLLIRDTLTPFAADLTDGLWHRAGDKTATADARFRALVALAAFDADSPRWKDAANRTVEQLLRQPSVYLGDWRTALRPVASTLIAPLGEVFHSKVQADKRQVAAEVLAGYAADDAAALVDLAADADAEQFALLVPLLQRHRAQAAQLLETELGKTLANGTAEADRVAKARRTASAAAALLRLDQPALAWPVLRHTPTPDARSYLVRDLAPRGVAAALLVQRLDEENDVSARRALILALGEYTEEQLPAAARGLLVRKLLGWYRNDPDAGIHGAIDWLLRHGKEGPAPRRLDWSQAAAVASIDEELKGKPPTARQGWYVTRIGATMSVVRGPVEFTMGSQVSEAGRFADETPHRRRIGRSFAVATKAVTVGQWKEFLRSGPPGVPTNWGAQHALEDECPINAVDWYTAAKYCRWLSEQEGVKEVEMCYPKMADIKEGMKPYADYLSRPGYRLPTEAEWEYACRAGSATAHCQGNDVDLLSRYGWFVTNSDNRTWPVGQKRPNDLGQFDMHGNVWAWVQDGYASYLPGPERRPMEDKEDIRDIRDALSRVLRGGSFYELPSLLRSAYRISLRPTNRNYDNGFRLARTLPLNDG